jgi:hypothetical protein
MPDRWTPGRLFVALWGIGGVLFLLGQAIFRLVPFALEPLRDGSLTPSLCVLYAIAIVGNAYAEGYRGFQLRFAPRVVARAMHLAKEPRPLHVLFAPWFCMAYFHSTKRARISAWIVTTAVFVAIAVVRHVPQPWRGVIDAGVVIGLLWGMVSVAALFVRTLGRTLPPGDPQLPGSQLTGTSLATGR